MPEKSPKKSILGGLQGPYKNKWIGRRWAAGVMMEFAVATRDQFTSYDQPPRGLISPLPCLTFITKKPNNNTRYLAVFGSKTAL